MTDQQQSNEQPAQGHDHGEHDGEAPCLHCVLAEAFLKWSEPQTEIDPGQVGAAIGQFMTEIMLSMGEAEHRADFREGNMAGQMFALAEHDQLNGGGVH